MDRPAIFAVFAFEIEDLIRKIDQIEDELISSRADPEIVHDILIRLEAARRELMESLDAM